MSNQKDNTEEKIVEAAKTVFIKKGMDGARMQEIADEAGINKALLHYYFRSKEKLFDAIFERIIRMAFPKITQIIFSDIHFRLKVERAIDTYLDLLLKHPYLPAFILKEINRDASLFINLVKKFGFDPQPVLRVISDAMDRGEIVRMKPEHLMINVISLSVFPFAARPMISYVAFGGDEKAMKAFLEERRQVVKEFVIRAIVVSP
ncbi:MAG: helix-turn-helix domain-containing protein [Prolixibacteraceae bacterium]